MASKAIFGRSFIPSKTLYFMASISPASMTSSTIAAAPSASPGQFDFVDATFDDKTKVPRIPPYRLGGGLFWRDTGGWFGKVSLLHAFSHTEIAPFETTTKGYNLLKAEVSYTHKFDKRVAGITDVTIGLVGDNLLDDKIRNSASFKKDEILLPGRGVRGFVNARF